jgi:hypothetical protein
MKLKGSRANPELGSALLIAIFALMLISVVGIALLVSTGTDSALAGNYRNSTGAYYAALAGLAEAKARLLPQNHPLPGFPVPNGGSVDVHQVVYILNPRAGEAVNPTDPSNPYYDREYATEFAWGLGGVTVQTTASMSSVAGLPAQFYKWVRVNPVTEAALHLDVDGQGANDQSTPLFSTGMGLNRTSTGAEAFEITAFAVMPDKSAKILQYVAVSGASAASPNLSSAAAGPLGYPAGLTLLGSSVQYTGPGNGNFYIRGQDQCGTNTLTPAIGFANSGDAVGSSLTNIQAGATPSSNYQGAPAQAPGPPPVPSNQSIADVTNWIQPSWLTPSGLDAVVQDITRSADVVINGNASGSTISSQAASMSASNPMIIVVNGDLNLNAWHNSGYGLLLVTGTLYYDPDATWEGLVLVIGQGDFVSTKHGTGGIDGAVLVAKTRDSAGNLLPSLGAASFSQTGGGANSGRGINYSSCWISGQPGSPGALGLLPYKVLSFREITQ